MSEKQQPKRWPARQKREVVLRLLRGESLDVLRASSKSITR